MQCLLSTRPGVPRTPLWCGLWPLEGAWLLWGKLKESSVLGGYMLGAARGQGAVES